MNRRKLSLAVMTFSCLFCFSGAGYGKDKPAETASLITAHISREVDMAGVVPVKGRYYTVQLLEGAAKEEQIRLFNEKLAVKNEGKIDQCSRVISSPAGVANGNFSYGGYCLLDKDKASKNVLICRDEMLGRLVIKGLNSEERPQIIDVATFTVENCVGG